MKNIDGKRLRQLLGRFSDLRIAVVGDFFLDSHFDCDPTLDERSLETGKTCYQVVRTRRQPGAAGLVAAYLRALGVGSVDAVGFCGDGGEGGAAVGHAVQYGDCWLGRGGVVTRPDGDVCYARRQRAT